MIVMRLSIRWAVSGLQSVVPSKGQHLTDAQTDIRIGTRTDKEISSGGNTGKVARVEQILGSK